MTTKADRELAEDVAKEFTNRLFCAQSSQAKYAMIFGDLDRVILAAFAKRDAGKVTDTERLDWLDVNERLNSTEKGDQFQHCILNAQSNPPSVAFGKTLRSCIDSAMKENP